MRIIWIISTLSAINCVNQLRYELCGARVLASWRWSELRTTTTTTTRRRRAAAALYRHRRTDPLPSVVALKYSSAFRVDLVQSPQRQSAAAAAAVYTACHRPRWSRVLSSVERVAENNIRPVIFLPAKRHSCQTENPENSMSGHAITWWCMFGLMKAAIRSASAAFLSCPPVFHLYYG